MDNNITKINNHPAVTGEALLLTLFIMLGFYVVNSGIGKRVDHAVTGAGADYKIVGKRDDVFQVYQDDILALSIFKRVYDFTCKFQCVQISPRLVNGAENNFV